MSNKPKLIGLTGLAGTGKDTLREMLETHHGYIGMAFADPLRDMIGQLLDASATPRKWMTERHLKELPIPNLGVSYRQLAQTLGTEWGREKVDPALWVRIMAARIAARIENHLYVGEPAPLIVISDVRMPNEAELIRDQGGVIWRLERSIARAVRPHDSEALIGTLPADRIINNLGNFAALLNALSSMPEMQPTERTPS